MKEVFKSYNTNKTELKIASLLAVGGLALSACGGATAEAEANVPDSSLTVECIDGQSAGDEVVLSSAQGLAADGSTLAPESLVAVCK